MIAGHSLREWIVSIPAILIMLYASWVQLTLIPLIVVIAFSVMFGVKTDKILSWYGRYILLGPFVLAGRAIRGVWHHAAWPVLRWCGIQTGAAIRWLVVGFFTRFVPWCFRGIIAVFEALGDAVAWIINEIRRR